MDFTVSSKWPVPHANIDCSFYSVRMFDDNCLCDEVVVCTCVSRFRNICFLEFYHFNDIRNLGKSSFLLIFKIRNVMTSFSHPFPSSNLSGIFSEIMASSFYIHIYTHSKITYSQLYINIHIHSYIVILSNYNFIADFLVSSLKKIFLSHHKFIIVYYEEYKYIAYIFIYQQAKS